MRPIWVLANLTFREAMRRRIMLAGLLLGICFLIVFSIGFHYIIQEVTRELTVELPSQSMVNLASAEVMNGFEMMGLYGTRSPRRGSRSRSASCPAAAGGSCRDG